MRASGRFSRRVSGRLVPVLQLAVNGVGVLAAAAGPVHAVVARVARFHAGLGGQVTEQTREQRRHEAHAQEARAALRVRQRTRPVGTGVADVVVVVGTVVENALHQTHARPVLDHALGRTQTLSVAGEARRKRPWRRTLAALTFPAALTDVQMRRVQLFHRGLFERSVRWEERMRGCARLSPYGSVAVIRQQALLRRRAAVAPGAPRAGGPAERRRTGGPVFVVVVHVHQEHLVSPLVLPRRRARPRGRSACYGRALRVLVTGADGFDLIQGQDGPRREVRMSDGPSALTVAIHKTRSATPDNRTDAMFI